MANPGPEQLGVTPNGVSDHLISERGVGLILAALTVSYVMFIVICDSVKERRLVISINTSRFVLDGLTFATGCTVGLVFVDTSVFAIVASNYIYATVTALSCVIGPIINLAERYGRTLPK